MGELAKMIVMMMMMRICDGGDDGIANEQRSTEKEGNKQRGEGEGTFDGKKTGRQIDDKNKNNNGC